MAKILLVRTDGIGDVLLSVPLAGAIKRERPGDEVWLLTRSYTRELGENHPDIDGVLTLDNDGGIEHPSATLIRTLQSGSFDSTVLIYPRFRIALLLRRAGIPVRVGTGYRWFSFLFTHRVYEHRKNIEKHELEYNLALLKPLGIWPAWGKPEFLIPDSARDRATEILREHDIDDGESFVVIHPGSGGSALEWPSLKYAALADELRGNHHIKVLVTGGPKETNLLEKFRENCSPAIGIVKSLPTLSELGALLSKASLVISNSTGPLHLATAVGTEVIGLYPPIQLCSPRRWGPYGQTDSVIEPPCRSFRTRKEALKKMPNCMDLITVENVLAMAMRKLNRI